MGTLALHLFPDDHIFKAQLVEYYFKLAPTILAYVKGRQIIDESIDSIRAV